jgi:SAM-dependent methyltransferase
MTDLHPMASKTTWGMGEYELMAELLMPVAELVVERLEVASDTRVLDVACGTGNLAVVAAERGAAAVGVDFEPNLLKRARARSARVEWRECDATNMDVPSAAFDVVASVFGAIYALDHTRAAAELARACRPGGSVALTAWTPGSFMPSLGGALGPFLPPPPADMPPPSNWGDEATLAPLLEGAELRLEQTTLETLELRFPTEAAAVTLLVRSAGHVMVERDRLVREGGWDDLIAAVGELVRERNTADRAGARLQLDYLLTVATRGS